MQSVQHAARWRSRYSTITPATEIPLTLLPDQSLAKPFRFLDLCPELRNKIYEVVYEEQPPTTVDLSTLLQVLPPMNLILTSRQTHSEAYGYYTVALDQFWQSHNFTFNTSLPWPTFLGDLVEMYMRTNEVSTSITALGHRVDQLAQLDVTVSTGSGTLTSSVSRFTLKGVRNYLVTPQERRLNLGRPRGIVASSGEHVGMLDLMARWFVDHHDYYVTRMSTGEACLGKGERVA